MIKVLLLVWFSLPNCRTFWQGKWWFVKNSFFWNPIKCIYNLLQLFTNFKLLVILSIPKLYDGIISISVVNRNRIFTESGISDTPITLSCHVKNIYPSLANVPHLESSTFKYHLKLPIFTVTKKANIHTIIIISSKGQVWKNFDSKIFSDGQGLPKFIYLKYYYLQYEYLGHE